MERSAISGASNNSAGLKYPFHPECFGPIFAEHAQKMKDVWLDKSIPFDVKYELFFQELVKMAKLNDEMCEIQKIDEDMAQFCKDDSCSYAWMIVRLLAHVFRVYELVVEMEYRITRTKATHNETIDDYKVVFADLANLDKIRIGKN
eukprot:CAMPEP_0168341506 /NCGR_PEP_ID=MMETSP0213-20121227/14738_1 /TAXON_ID=151035 /ORGANISM="Euplotes harpa, Strain FSP1.4" /LENGTH=146 /DNA_ID=CAMNT_0008348023 /DNA_START=147 /DNA_END=587 /DNA_ORIENTATION=-